MLPFPLYELLPYLYLGIGALGFALFDSVLIFIASTLIISAGFIVLWMRIDFRRSKVTDADILPFVKRSKTDRRKKSPATFPLVDYLGATVNSDRRTAERRAVAA